MAFTNPADNLLSFGLRSGQEVADFGAGPGHYALAAGEIVGPGGHVIAVEIQKKLVQKVRSEVKNFQRENISVIWGDIEKEGGSTLADESVDVVLLSNVLFQVKDVRAVLKEAARILHKKGVIYVVDWSDSFGGLGPQQGQLLTPAELKETARDANLKPGESVDVGDHHWGLILST